MRVILIIALMFKGKTFLYIEDEITIAHLVLDELRDLGAKCIHTTEFKDAVKKVNFQKYDLILSDLKIINGTSEEIITSIKNNPKHVNNKTPIILCSGFIDDELKENFKKSIYYFLNKPFQMDTLIEIISNSQD